MYTFQDLIFVKHNLRNTERFRKVKIILFVITTEEDNSLINGELSNSNDFDINRLQSDVACLL